MAAAGLDLIKARILVLYRYCHSKINSTSSIYAPQLTKLSLLKILVQRDMEARYKGSILGNLWPVFNQLIQLLIYTYVFSIVLKIKLDVEGFDNNSPFMFGLWLFSGLIPWIAFSTGLHQASISVSKQPNLVKKVVFPLSLLPLVPVLSNFIESTFGLMLLISSIIFIKHELAVTIFLLPLAWIPQLLITSGLGYLTASLTVFIRDVPQTLSVFLNLWFYATPLIYPASMIPDPIRQWIFWLNPLAAVGEMYRDTLLVGKVQHWNEWYIATALSAALYLFGAWCYQKLRPIFADIL